MAGKPQDTKLEKLTGKATPTDKKLYWPIDKVYEWQDNPRGIKQEDLDRLKKQIIELGEYKPLIITPEGEVIGGNMRLRAYRELGRQEVWVSIVEPKDEQDKLRYALSDNDAAGYYMKDFLSSLVQPYKEDLSFLQDFHVDLNVGQDLTKFVEDLDTTEKSKAYKGQFQIVIDCENEIEQKEHYDRLTELGYKCRVLTL